MRHFHFPFSTDFKLHTFHSHRDMKGLIEFVPTSLLSEHDSLSDIENSDEDTSVPSNSVLYSIFLVLNTMIGSGIFNQPFVVANTGVALFVIMFAVAATFTWLGLVTLVEVGVSLNLMDYGSVASYTFGAFGEWLVEFAICIYSIGALLSYVIVIGSLSDNLVVSWGWKDSAYGIYYITSGIVLLFVLPNCLRRYFAHLTFVSVISIASVFCVLCLVVIAGPIVSTEKVIHPAVFIPSGIFSELGSIIFTLSCSTCTFHTFKFMNYRIRSTSSWQLVSTTSVCVGFTMCMIMGLVGYFLFGFNTESIVVNNFHGHYADPFKVLVVLHLILYIPLDFTILRYSLLKCFGVSSGGFTSWGLHALFSMMMLTAVTAGVLLLYSAGWTSGQAFSIVLNLSGGIAGSMTSFVLPAAFYVINMPYSAKYYTPCVMMFFLGTALIVLIPYSIFAKISY
mmetsp:Transcript_27199/g.38699  ORF Transcript_27199/g.38699 Transcript_27199/m.38699 type:complete len:451 (-) Transcript_27199:40-1392(-)